MFFLEGGQMMKKNVKCRCYVFTYITRGHPTCSNGRNVCIESELLHNSGAFE